MYTEERNEFPIKDLLIKILFLALFVFLLLWLFPIGRNKVELKPLTDQIFNGNVQAMKEAAKAYYTNERLPKNVGSKVSMTLQEMLNRKLVLPFTDKNGESCDTQNSYVEITRMDKEFSLKVYLSCNKQNDYVVEIMGCNDKCKVIDNDKTADNDKPVKPVKPDKPVKPVTPTKKTKTITEYEYKRTISNSTWSAYTAWSDQYKAETDSLKRKEQTLVKGVKTVSHPYYNYLLSRQVLSDWSAWSTWSTTSQTETYYKDVETQTVDIITWLDEWYPWSDWTTANVGATEHMKMEYKLVATDPVYSNWAWSYNFTSTKVYSTYPTGYDSTNATTKYELVDYQGYYTYAVYKRTITPGSSYYLFRYSTQKSMTTKETQYRYRTRSYKTETKWSSSSYEAGWTYTGTIQYAGSTYSYSYTDWLNKLPDGYSTYQTKKQYAYSTKTTTSKDEFTWSTNNSLGGWTKTGKTKTKTITI